VEAQVCRERQLRLPLAFVSLLIREMFGDDLPDYLIRLIAENVTPPMRLWVARYGRRSLLSDAQGTKHYLMLLDVLPGAHAARIQRRRHILPLGLPMMITQGHESESLLSRLGRYWVQAGFVLYRLRFHSVEGVRYLIESSRFRRLLIGVEQ
jgi:hypothetical protein